ALAFEDRAPRGEPRWGRWVRGANVGLWVLATLTLAASLIVLPIRFGGGISAVGIVGAAAVLLLATGALRRPAAIVAMPALALAFVVPMAHWVAPGLDRLWLSRAAAAMIARHPPPPGTVPLVIGYGEPSLVFLLDNQLRFAMPNAAAAVA